MTNATAALYQGTDTEPIPYGLTERGEARVMLDELRRLLMRGGRLNLCALERAMTAQGTPVTRRTLIRWFGGQSTPLTVTPVEHLARAAGVDRAYLMIGARR